VQHVTDVHWHFIKLMGNRTTADFGYVQWKKHDRWNELLRSFRKSARWI